MIAHTQARVLKGTLSIFQHFNMKGLTEAQRLVILNLCFIVYFHVIQNVLKESEK